MASNNFIDSVTDLGKRIWKRIRSKKFEDRPQLAFFIIIIFSLVIFSFAFPYLKNKILPKEKGEVIVEETTSNESISGAKNSSPQETTTEGSIDIEKKKQDITSTLNYRSENGDVIFALYTQKPIAIDGKLDDWEGYSQNPISFPTFLEENYTDISDCSGTYFLAYDDDKLYIGLKVVDDVFSQPFGGKEMFKGDSLSLSMDTDLQGDFFERTHNDDDYQIGITPGDFQSLAPDSYVYIPTEGKGDEIKVASTLVKGGYIIEAEIPWWNFQNFLPKDGVAQGFDLTINDKDSLQERELAVSSSPNFAWDDPTSFGTMVLLDTRVQEISE
ncbi:MAG: hypothetical protein M1371_06160 [Actinobacteria bacterium]|nr:hypothetical protein [Actinomycetota bacterium]